MKWMRRAVGGMAVAYPIALVGVFFALRWVGERWWLSGLGLYLPRILLGAPLPVITAALVSARLPKLLWTQAAAAVLLVFPLMGFVVPRPWPRRDRASPVVRVLTYNINSGRGEGEFDAIVAEIDRHSPDILFLQEVGYPEKIVPILERKYPYIHTMDQFLLATRYPILRSYEPPRLQYDYDGKPHSPRFIAVAVDTPLGRITCYDVHPVSAREAIYRAKSQGKRGLLTGRVFSPAYAAIFYGNSGLRELQIRTVSQEASRETDPVLIAGDTNLPDLSFVLNKYLSGWQDGFIKAGWGFGYTFPTDKVAPWMRLDRIFASDELRFVHFEVCSSRASDHRCVVADLQRMKP